MSLPHTRVCMNVNLHPAFAAADHTSSLYLDLFYIEDLPLSEIPFLFLPLFMQYLSISHTNGSSPLAALGLAQCCSIWVA